MEKTTCIWKKIIMFASIVLAIAILAFTFYFREEIMVNKNNAAIDEQATAIVNTSNGNFTASNIDILKKASELLGVQYDWGGKGLKTLAGNWDPNPWKYKIIKGNVATSTEIINSQKNSDNGIDCSGLVYWTLTNVGLNKGYTLPTSATEYSNGTYGFSGFSTGFARNNPVPLDAIDWVTYIDSNSTTPHGFSELKGYKKNSNGTYSSVKTNATGSKSVADCDLTYLGSKVNVLKKNDFITSSLRYYEYYDQNGNKKTLPSGTIVISYGSGIPEVVNGTTTYPYEDHAWIFIGDLKTSDPNQVATILKNMGLNIPENAVANELIKQTGGTNTCWRIEAASGSGVTINNGNPDMGSLVGDKGIGPIWAFQVANEITGNYNLKVQKIDENGTELNLNGQNIFTVKRNNSVMNSYTVSGSVVSYNPVSITTNSLGDDVITIQETSEPEGYIKYNKTIELVIKKVFTTVEIDGKKVGKYVGHVKEVKINGETQTRTNNAYDNGKVYVDWLNGQIVVKIKNTPITGNYNIRVQKVDENGNELNLNGKNIFTTTRNNVSWGVSSIEDSIVNYSTVDITNSTNSDDTIIIKETGSISGYTPYQKEIKIIVEKTISNNAYICNVKEVQIDGIKQQGADKGWNYDSGNVYINWNSNLITIKVKNTKMAGKYNWSVEKVDTNGNTITSDSKFTIKRVKSSDKQWVTLKENQSTTSGKITGNNVKINSEDELHVYEITETQSPSGYKGLKGTITVSVKFKVVDGNYCIDTEKCSVDYSENDDRNLVSIDSTTNSIKILVKNPKVDLALKKTITHVIKSGETDWTRVTEENGFNVSRFTTNENNISINTNNLKTGTTTNAVYTMNKTPVEVAKGDQVRYSIRIYNEGEVAAKARIIKDYIPDGLKVLKVGLSDEELSAITMDEYNNSNKDTNCYIYDYESGVLTICLNGRNYINPFDGTTLSSDAVTVYCEVENDATGVLTNVAEIQEYQLSDGTNLVNDIDSTRRNWVAPNDEDKESNAKNSDAWRNYSNEQDSYLDGGWHPINSQDTGVNGNKGDDDDFDKLIVKQNYSLKIKKYNASDNNAGIDDVKFNITRQKNNEQEESFANVETENSIISYVENLSNYGNYSIIYTIEEVENTKYQQLDEPITLELIINEGKINGYKFAYGNNVYGDVKTTLSTFDCVNSDGVVLPVMVGVYQNNEVIITIANKVINQSQYGIRLRKISSGNNTPLQGVTFAGTHTFNATDANGYTNIITSSIGFDSLQDDTYNITEIDLGTNTGYTKFNSDISINVKKKLDNSENFVVDNYTVTCGNNKMVIDSSTKQDSFVITENNVNFIISAEETSITNIATLTLTVTNAPDNPLPLQIRKVSSEDGTTSLKGAEYTITRNGLATPLYENIDLTGTVSLTDSVEAGNSTVIYKVIEQNAPEGYDNVFYGKYIQLEVAVTAGVPSSVVAKVFNNNGTEDTTLGSYVSANIIDVASVKTIDLQIQNPETVKVIDLALKKIIIEVNGMEVKAANGIDSVYDRLTEGDDKFKVNTQPLKNGKFDAEYYLNKTPILVVKGSTVKYQIRIYNEGEEVDTTASKITDYIPTGLEFVNIYYQDETTPLVENTDYTYDETNNVLKITALANKELIAKFDGGDTLSYDYVTVECKVKDDAKNILTNVAEISEYKTEDGIVETDRDSEPNNWKNPNDGNSSNNDTTNKSTYNWQNYDGHMNNEIEDGKFKNYLGQQDDDDFEKIVVGEIDLVLKKIITHINEDSVDTLDSRFQRFQDGKVKVNTSIFNTNHNVTTADYYLNKTPIIVKINDTVTYQIRIYNEGSIDATASEITDYIPKGLDFVSASYNGKTLTSGEDYTYNSDTNNLVIKAMKGNLINKYPGGAFNNLDPEYDYVTVTCKVNGDIRGLLTNVAEISKYETFYGETTVDRDSETTDSGEWQEPEESDKSTLDGKSGTSWARYYDNTRTGQFMNYDGQQDDDDFEKIIVRTGYDLQIRKVSGLDNDKGLENVEISVQDSVSEKKSYTTDKNGYIQKLGIYEIYGTKLDMFTIEEVATNDGNYVKLQNRIHLFVEQREDSDGTVKIYGYYINFNEPRPEGDAVYNKLTTNTAVYHTYDENGNVVDVIITVSEDTTNVGNYNINVKIENNVSDLLYDVYIKKQDENGNSIDNAKFLVESDNFYGVRRTTVSTVNGLAYISKFTVSENNVNKVDTFTIQEIEVPNKYYLLKDTLQLVVTKGIKADKTGYEITGIKLLSNDKQSEQGKEVTIQGVELEKNGGTVDITAKLEKNVITVTVNNKEKEFDLALRKFITEVNHTSLEESREPIVDSSKLKSGESTTATYNHPKDPVQVHVEDIVEYSIRIYNEGARDGYAQLVMDDVPDGLLMIAPGDGTENTSKLNGSYRWKMYRKVMNNEVTTSENTIAYGAHTYVVTNDPKEAEIIVTDYLSKENGEALLASNGQTDENTVNQNLIKAFDSEIMPEPAYKELRVEFKVKTTNEPNEIIINSAQVTEDADEDGESVTDRDSTPNVWEDSPRNDDQDIEKIVVIKELEFDLSLRKFISKVNGAGPENSREPQVDSAKLKAGESTTAEYKHSKEAVLVSPTDIVEYTLRVYNEGEIDGYATKIMDDIPDGVEMVAPIYDEQGVATNANAEYRWVMYKEVKEDEKYTLTYNGKYYAVTENVKEAVLIVSDYLSKENGEAMMAEADVTNPNLIQAFNVKEMETPDYRDIKVEFKVKPSNEEGKEIINYAQITDDSDSDGNVVTDRDSTPNEWEDSPRDDDQDIEKIKVRYFDLALYKWVTTTIVTENGKTKEYASEHTQDDKSNVVNVTIPKSELDETVVKFKYTIKVENQGQLEGYAKEIKDHVPAGLKFLAEDNKEYGWELQEDGKITTDYLKDTLLQPGQTAEVTVVLTWINGENNLGEKWNFAEISEDYNDYGAPDKDSTPNNFKDEIKEDDEDKDVVMLNVRTGSDVIIYVVLITSILVILTAGVVGVKKYVLK